MRRRGRGLLRAAAILVTAGLTGWVATAATAGVASAGAAASLGTAGTAAGAAGGAQPFYADSGELTCPRGFTEGGIFPIIQNGHGVQVRGVVVDRPLPDDTTACGDDGRSTTATFTAYAGGEAVATAKQRADNERRHFSFTLSAPIPIVLIVVQVCRNSLLSGSTGYCGMPRSFPVIVT